MKQQISSSIYSIIIFRFARFKHLVVSLCALCVLCGEISAQDFKQVHPGVEYAQVERKIGDDPVKINLLRLDLTKVRLDVKLAMDTVVGTETTSSVANRHAAVAAINGGFFRLDNSIYAGDPAGVLMVDKVLLSESQNGRIAMMIENRINETRVEFDHADISHAMIIRGREYLVGTNRERRNDDLVIFTRAFGRTTLTGHGGAEFHIHNGRVRAIFAGEGSRPIPEAGFIVSASGKMREEMIRVLRAGTLVRLSVRHSSMDEVVPTSAFGRAEDITNGVSQLVKNGKVELTWEQEKASRAFAENRHPRTAVAKMKDGKFLMVTADGRQPGVSVGMTLQELADYLLSLGAADAINLDGGGSTTMFLDGMIVNKPSDANGERKVSDAIVVTLRRPAGQR